MAHRLAGRYLAQRTLFGMKFGLETMRALVEEMGHPERAYPSLLIAGTNGKGSVAAYCDAALRAYMVDPPAPPRSFPYPQVGV